MADAAAAAWVAGQAAEADEGKEGAEERLYHLTLLQVSNTLNIRICQELEISKIKEL